MATIDLATARVTDIVSLGYAEHARLRNGIDASNQDDGINIRPWPVRGMYMPDGVDTLVADGETYLVMANEGDARDYECFSEEARVADLTLDREAFPFAVALQADERLGRPRTTTAFPTADPATEIYSFGARSFTIRDTEGRVVFDSGSAFERITAAILPAQFNSTNSENDSVDSRSDDKGPSPRASRSAARSGRLTPSSAWSGSAAS